MASSKYGDMSWTSWNHFVFNEDPHGCQSCGTRKRMARTRVAMKELDEVVFAALLHEQVVEFLPGDHGAQGHGCNCQVLGHCHDIGNGVEAVPAEGSTGSPESRDGLVENQENLMYVADLPYALR